MSSSTADRIRVAALAFAEEIAAAVADELGAGGDQPPERLISVAAAAADLGISRTTAYQEIGAGRLRSLRVGRRRLVSSGAIAEYIERAESTSAGEPTRTMSGVTGRDSGASARRPGRVLPAGARAAHAGG